MSVDTPPVMPGTRNATLADMVTILRGQRAAGPAPGRGRARRRDPRARRQPRHRQHDLAGRRGRGDLGGRDIRPTVVADEGLADKLGISLAYLRRLRASCPDLWDANVNGWLHGKQLAGYPGDGRKFLVRLFQPDSDRGDGLSVARAFLSDSYKVIDNLDALMATLDGIRQAGTEVVFDGLDLTERRLYARVVAPGWARSPWRCWAGTGPHSAAGCMFRAAAGPGAGPRRAWLRRQPLRHATSV